MKVLFQCIGRYQDDLPSFKIMEVEGKSLNKVNVQKAMEDFFDDDTDFLQDERRISKSDTCWCVWGEEADIILTVLEK